MTVQPYPGNSNWPTDFQGTRITAKYVDLNGAPLEGFIHLTPTVNAIISGSTKTIVVGRRLTIPLSADGEIDRVVPSTDDPDVNPTGWTYQVNEDFPGGRRYNIVAPLNATLDLSHVAPVEASPGTVTLVGTDGEPGLRGTQFNVASPAIPTEEHVPNPEDGDSFFYPETGEMLVHAGGMWVPAGSVINTGPGGAGDIEWKGYNWLFRDFTGAPTWNGQWDSSNLITVDGDGYLHLRVKKTGSTIKASELRSTRAGWGYGTYRWVVGSDITTMYPNVVLGLFTYDDLNTPSHNEIDIEGTGWGYGTPSWWNGYFYPDGTNNKNASVLAFDNDAPVSTQEFEWAPGVITWRFWVGTDTSVAPAYTKTIRHGEAYSYENPVNGMIYSGVHNVPVPKTEQVMMNLWVYTEDGAPNSPEDTPDTEVVIRDFKFTPLNRVDFLRDRNNHFGTIDVSNLTGLETSRVKKIRRESEDLWEFMNGLEGTPFTPTTTGAGQIGIDGSWSGETLGVVMTNARTDSTSSASFMTQDMPFVLGQNTVTVSFRMAIHAEPTIAENYRVRGGLMNNIATPTNGVYFTMDRLYSATNWVAVSMMDGNSTRRDTGVPLTIDTFRHFSIEVADIEGVKTATFYIADVEVAKITSNVPTSAGRLVGLGGGAYKLSGTANNNVSWDYMGYLVEFWNTR